MDVSHANDATPQIKLPTKKFSGTKGKILKIAHDASVTRTVMNELKTTFTTLL